MSSPTRTSTPRIGEGFRLQWEAVQNCHVLLYPEGMVKLNGSAGEIMKRCDGARSIEAIAADIEQTHALSGLEADVIGFVDLAGRQQWLKWD
jgi:pyrroloquinoline quinone biosynthesis protein D